MCQNTLRTPAFRGEHGLKNIDLVSRGQESQRNLRPHVPGEYTNNSYSTLSEHWWFCLAGSWPQTCGGTGITGLLLWNTCDIIEHPHQNTCDIMPMSQIYLDTSCVPRGKFYPNCVPCDLNDNTYPVQSAVILNFCAACAIFWEWP